MGNTVKKVKELDTSNAKQAHLSNQSSLRRLQSESSGQKAQRYLSSSTSPTGQEMKTQGTEGTDMPVQQDVISNGIVGLFVSTQIAERVGKFWRLHIDSLPRTDKLEIACSIGFAAVTESKQIKALYFKSCRGIKMQDLSIKLFDLFGRIFCGIDKHTVDLHATLCSYHEYCKEQDIGLSYAHFAVFVNAMNESFAYYFPLDYDQTMRHCMDQMLMVVANIIAFADESVNRGNLPPALSSLDTCLRCEDGQKYLYEYLDDMHCYELVKYLKLYALYKTQTHSAEKAKLRSKIIAECIGGNADNEGDDVIVIEISDQCKQDILQHSNANEIDAMDSVFEHCYNEIYELILQRHWSHFQRKMSHIQESQ